MQDETAMAPPTYTPNVSWCALCGALVAHLRPWRIPLELDTLTPHICGIRPPKARRRKRREPPPFELVEEAVRELNQGLYG